MDYNGNRVRKMIDDSPKVTMNPDGFISINGETKITHTPDKVSLEAPEIKLNQ